MGPNSFIFTSIFTKKHPHRRSMPPSQWVCAPPMGNFWIHHWCVFFQVSYHLMMTRSSFECHIPSSHIGLVPILHHFTPLVCIVLSNLSGATSQQVKNFKQNPSAEFRGFETSSCISSRYRYTLHSCICTTRRVCVLQLIGSEYGSLKTASKILLLQNHRH